MTLVLRTVAACGSARSGGMAVELACRGDILFLLRGHLRSIWTARHAARPEFPTSDLVLGLPFFVAGIAGHPSPSSWRKFLADCRQRHNGAVLSAKREPCR
jgi:hypothetical protein